MNDPIIWLADVDRFDGNPTATVAVARERWEAVGASFVEVDDGDDETPGLAVGQIDGLAFGVLDYGEDETFLLVAEPAASHERTVAVLEALSFAGVLALDREVIDIAGLEPRSSGTEVEGRLAALESRIAMLETAAGDTGVDVVVEKLGTYPALATQLIYQRALHDRSAASSQPEQLRFPNADVSAVTNYKRIFADLPLSINFTGVRIAGASLKRSETSEQDPSALPEDPSSQVA